MSRQLKRFISVLMTIVMVVSMLHVETFAAEFREFERQDSFAPAELDPADKNVLYGPAYPPTVNYNIGKWCSTAL